MTLGDSTQWRPWVAPNQSRTETTVVEEELFDEDGKLVSKKKTTTTRTYTEPFPNQPYVTY